MERGSMDSSPRGGLVDAAAESIEVCAAALAMTFGSHEQGGG
jgi:hypothetical protein